MTNSRPDGVYITERVALADLPDYLRRHKLRVVEVERWQRRGLLVWTENDVIPDELPDMPTSESMQRTGEAAA